MNDKQHYRQLLNKRIPILNWLPSYTFSTFWHDLLAGITVGLTEIPQGVAYATIAGLSPEYGLYSGLLDGVIYAVLGGCKELNIGPTSVLALLLQPHVAEVGPEGALLLTFLSGIILFTAAIFQLGFFINFFSYPVLAGFTCAVSLQVSAGQIPNLLGIRGKRDNFIDVWKSIFANISEVSKWDAVLGMGSILSIVILKQLGRFGSLRHRSDWSRCRNVFGSIIYIFSLSSGALTIAIATTISYFLYEESAFKITGTIGKSFPPFRAPHFSTSFNGTTYSFSDLVSNFGVTLAFIPLLTMLETVSIGKRFARGKSLDGTQEIIAVGICNIMGSFVSSMPVTGTFSRSALNKLAGVKTTFSGVFTSLLLLLSVAFLTPTFYYVPKATLAGVIICVLLNIFDWKAFVLLWNTKKLDLLPFLATFFNCLFFHVELGILIGIAVNLLFILYASVHPKIMTKREEAFEEFTDVIVVTPKDDIYFPAAEYLRQTVSECTKTTSVVIINGNNMSTMDATLAKTMGVLVQEIVAQDKNILLVNFQPTVAQACVKADKGLKNYFRNNKNSDNLFGWQ